MQTGPEVGQRDDLGPILVVPPAGLCKDGTWCDMRKRQTE
jgi:hypothetical protein